MLEADQRHKRAKRKQLKHLEEVNEAWKVWKTCEVCGNQFCVNCAWEDRKPRTPRFQGVVVCLACDPRECDPMYPYMGDTIRRTTRGRMAYRHVMMLIFVRKLAKRPCETGDENCKCFPCTARKLERIRP